MDRVTVRQVGVDGKQEAGGRDGRQGREQDWRWTTLRPADLPPLGWLTRSPGGLLLFLRWGSSLKFPMPPARDRGGVAFLQLCHSQMLTVGRLAKTTNSSSIASRRCLT